MALTRDPMRHDMGRPPEPRDGKRRGSSSVTGWLFVVWMLTVCGTYLYSMLRSFFG